MAPAASLPKQHQTRTAEDVLIPSPAWSLMAVPLVAIAGVTLDHAATLIIAAVIGVFLWWQRSGDVWKSNYEAEKARAEHERIRADGYRSQVTEAKTRIQILEQRPDLEVLQSGQKELLVSLREHGEQANRAWEREAAIYEELIPILISVKEKLDRDAAARRPSS